LTKPRQSYIISEKITLGLKYWELKERNLITAKRPATKTRRHKKRSLYPFWL